MFLHCHTREVVPHCRVHLHFPTAFHVVLSCFFPLKNTYQNVLSIWTLSFAGELQTFSVCSGYQGLSRWVTGKYFFFPSVSCLFTFLAISLDAWKLWLSARVLCPWLFYVAATLLVSDLCLSQVTNTLFSSKSFIVWTFTLKSLFLSVFIQYEVRVQILSFSCLDLIAPPSVCLVNSIHCMHLSCFFLFYYFRCLYEFVALLT